MLGPNLGINLARNIKLPRSTREPTFSSFPMIGDVNKYLKSTLNKIFYFIWYLMTPLTNKWTNIVMDDE